jgi:hypothetical protein
MHLERREDIQWHLLVRFFINIDVKSHLKKQIVILNISVKYVANLQQYLRLNQKNSGRHFMALT